MSAQCCLHIERAVTAAGHTLVVCLRGTVARGGPRGGAHERATALATSLGQLCPARQEWIRTMHPTRAAFVERDTSGGKRGRMIH